VVGNYPGIIWSLDSNRRFTLYDGAFLREPGKALFGIVGQNMHEYAENYPDALHPSLLDNVERTFAGEPQDWMLEQENSIFRCNTMPILDAEGTITGVVGASVDVTDMIRMQMDLDEARRSAEAANLAKSEFLSRMSHEIRTPMNAIIGMTQIAQSANDGNRVKSSLDKIGSASKHLLSLINDILDISKIEANKLELQSELFDLEKCVDGVGNMIAVRAEEKKQSFRLSFSDSLPKLVMGDELRFTQVLINLLGNAIKFTPVSGAISLEVRELSREKGECVLEARVRDDGIGIAQEHQKKLFMPFEQGDGSITREYGGSGLGLAICKYIVELMGGNIWVESAPGEGSMFYFTVRMRVGGEEVGDSHNEEGNGYRKYHYESAILSIDDLSGFTLLLVEDLEINREIVSAILEDTRVCVEHAENGAKAVEMFASAPEKYDLILMDMQMPVMDGLEATRRIRAMGTNKARNVPILAMTANVFREDVDKCREAGMDDHIAKPIDSNLLFSKLEEFLVLTHRRR
jgi:signal transduction histidine kinase/CheY-like chemotaxis protein